MSPTSPPLLSAPESYGIDGGQPLVLHGVKVGRCWSVNDGQRVTFQVAIDPESAI